MSETMDPLDSGVWQVGARLQQLRRRAGLTQAELGRLLGWGGRAQVRISNYERGRRMPGLDDLQQLAAALSVGLAELVGEEAIEGSRSAPMPVNDDQQRLLKLFGRLSAASREAALQFMRELSIDDNAERAALVAELHRVAHLSSPRTRVLVESLAESIEAGALGDSDADVLSQLVNLLALRRDQSQANPA